MSQANRESAITAARDRRPLGLWILGLWFRVGASWGSEAKPECLGVLVDFPTEFVNLLVTGIADQQQVVQVRGSVLRPPENMVSLAPQRIRVAPDATLITGHQRDPLCL